MHPEQSITCACPCTATSLPTLLTRDLEMWRRVVDRRLRSIPLASLLRVLLLFGCAGFAKATLQSVPELEAAMYKPVDGTACVTLLTLYGEIGCGNPGRDKVVAPIVRFQHAGEILNKKASILLPFSELSIFLKRTLSESEFRENVAGVLVQPPKGVEQGISDDYGFPEAIFSPYRNQSYVWNPYGSGIMGERFDFPVYLLSEDDAILIEGLAEENKKRNLKYPVNVAEFDVVMQTTKVGTTTSDACLQEWSCLPLGGYSVWSLLPPMEPSASQEKQIVLTIASMDSASFFRDKSIGADSSISGLISLLAAVEALSKLSNPDLWEKQLLIAVFTGESWGYLGSRRFLMELSEGGSSVQGLNGSLIYQILEVGSVGMPVNNTFYAHTQESKASAATEQILDALQKSASIFMEDNNVSVASVELANSSNPGVPPSSLMSFLHENDSTAGVVLTEFDSVFLNKFYHNGLDEARQLDVTSMVAAASIIAQTIHILVTGNSSTDNYSLTINETLIQQLIECLLTCDPGMACSLANRFITATQKCPNHYVGVFLGNPSEEAALENVDDTARFIWNYLATYTASTADTTAMSQCTTKCENDNEICVGSTMEHKGTCMLSTTRYVPAYSTRLKYGSSGWFVVDANPGDMMGEVDPVFTESYWKVLGVRVYMKESVIFDGIVLLTGIIVTVMSLIITVGAKTAFRKRLKLA